MYFIAFFRETFRMVTVDFPRRITAVEARQSIWVQAKFFVFFGGEVGSTNFLNIFFMIKVMLCVFILPEWMLLIISDVQILQNSSICVII